MKIEHQNITVQGISDEGAIACGIDESGMNHVMSILSNLYSDAYTAVLREYSTNARDSHVEAGNRAPIEITSPNSLSPQLTVTDYGIGMDKDDIIQTFSRYGSSTKRDSNSQVGAFGVGSKSAFTISPQFTVAGTKNGTRTSVLFRLKEDNTPVLQVLGESETSDPNGVSVGVPVSDVAKMNETIKKFFYVWTPGTVLVDGTEPTSLWTDEKVITLSPSVYMIIAEKEDYMWSYQNKSTFSLNVLMGGVSYEVDREIINKCVGKVGFPTTKQGTKVYVSSAIGSVDISPSRESLRDTQKTINQVITCIDAFSDDLNQTIQNELDLEPSYTKAVSLLHQWGKNLDVGDKLGWEVFTKRFRYKGTPIASTVIVPFKMKQIIRDYLWTEGTVHNVSILNHCFAITGVDTERKLSLVKNRVFKWVEAGFLMDRGVKGKKDIKVFVPDTPNGRIDWFAWGNNGNLIAVDFDAFRSEAASLYRKENLNPVGTAPLEGYQTRLVDGTIYNLPVNEIMKHAKTTGKEIILLERGEDFFTKTDRVQVRLQGKQRLAVAQKRFSNHIDHKAAYMIFQTQQANLIPDDQVESSFILKCLGEKLSVAVVSYLMDNQHRITSSYAKEILDKAAVLYSKDYGFKNRMSNLLNLVISEDKFKTLLDSSSKEVSTFVDKYPMTRYVDLRYNMDKKVFVDTLVNYVNSI